MKIVCTICARGGSKGVKNKNVKDIAGMPLIAYTVIRAQQAGIFSAIAVSSDSDDILNAAKKYCPSAIIIKRPADMASDTAGKLPAIKHCFTEAEKISGTTFDLDVDLDVTSPLRTVEDIKKALEIYLSRPDADNLISVTPSRRTPYFSMLEDAPRGFIHTSKLTDPPLLRRQDAPNCYDINASIYIWRREKLLSLDRVLTPYTLPYVMPAERSVDVDSELDWRIVEMLLKDRVDEYKL